MRLVKTLGLALALIAALAVVGVPGTMAESEHPEIVLCGSTELVCEPGNTYSNPTEIHLETLPAEPTKLLTNIGTIECKEALIILTLLNKLAKLIDAHVLAANLKECKLGETACTDTVNELGGFSVTPALIKLRAVFTPIELEGKNTTFTIKCGAFINCTYGAGAETQLTAHSDEQGHFLLLAEEAKLKKVKGFLCPSESKLDANYHAINLDKDLSLKLNLWIEL